MKSILVLCAALTLLTLQSCERDKGERSQTVEKEEPPVRRETPTKMIESLVGEWQMAATGNDRQGGADQTLTFTEEARYIVRKGNQKTDSGAFRMNEQLKNLYLESEANEKPREYEMELNRDTLVLSAKGDSQQGAAEESVYVRRN